MIAFVEDIESRFSFLESPNSKHEWKKNMLLALVLRGEPIMNLLDDGTVSIGF
jgi:hypothetical protein